MLLRTALAIGVGLLAFAPAASAAPAISGLVGAPSSQVFGEVVTFSGAVFNNGTNAADNFTDVIVENDPVNPSTGVTITSVTPIGPVAAGNWAPFTVTARITGAPGTQAHLRLKATGITSGGPQPTVIFSSGQFLVQDAVVLTASAERKRGGIYQPCSGFDCTVSIQDGLKYTVSLQNVSDVNATVTLSAPAPANTTDTGVSSTIPTTSVVVPAGATQTYVREVSVNDFAEPGQIISFAASATYTATAQSTTVTNEPAGNSPAVLMASVVDPRLTVTNELTDANGGPLIAGEQVQSTILVDNTGNANATTAVTTVDLTNLRTPTDVRINGVLASTRATVTDNQLVVRIGSGANSTLGGTIAPSDAPVAISFNSIAGAVGGASPTARSDASVSFGNGGISPQSASHELPLTPVAPVLTGTVGAPASTTHGRTVTFSGTVTNAGSTAAESFTSVSFADDGSQGLTDVSVPAIGALAAGASTPFTATATISGLAGTQGRLRLRAIGTTASAEVPDPEVDIDGAAFVIEAVVVEATATPTPAVSPSPTATPGPAAPVDTAAPVITGLRAPRGRLGFALSEPAQVVIRVERSRPGRRSRGRCVRPTARLRGARRCKRFLKLGTLRHDGILGANQRTLPRRVGGKRLTRGTYRAILTATDAAGNASKTATVSFEVR